MTMENSELLLEQEEQTAISDAKFVANYLSKHPEFFLEHPDLLAEINLPHASGQAISLVEKQVSILRERHIALRSKLNNLMNAAHENDKLFGLTKGLILATLGCNTVPELNVTLTRTLKRDFAIDDISLIIFDQGNSTETLNDKQVRVVSLQTAKDNIGALIDAKQSVRGLMRPKELEYLFPRQVQPILSAAIITLQDDEGIIGALAIGSTQPDRYHSGMDTLFLDFVGSVLSLSIRKLLPST